MSLLHAMLRDRRRAWIWWAVALALTAALVVLSYSAVEGETALEDSLGDMPDSLKALMGIDDVLTLTSPGGYLNSQWFANMLPLLLTIYGIGLAARAVAGEENAGRLELLLAHPVPRRRVLGERGLAAVALLVSLAVVSTFVVFATSPAGGLDGLPVEGVLAASAASLLLALLHAAVTFGVGAWTGSRGIAIAAGAAVAAAGFLVQSLASIGDGVRGLRWLSPWQWFFDARPIVEGFAPIVVPSLATIAVAAAVVAAGARRFEIRDIGAA